MSLRLALASLLVAGALATGWAGVSARAQPEPTATPMSTLTVKERLELMALTATPLAASATHSALEAKEWREAALTCWERGTATAKATTSPTPNPSAVSVPTLTPTATPSATSPPPATVSTVGSTPGRPLLLPLTLQDL